MSARGDDGAAWRRMPAGVWAMGFASLFMDVSSELIHALLPLFLVGSLGASMTTVGLLEGAAEATAAITKLFSGALSDLLGRRKLLMVSGYALAAVTKPVFPLANAVGWVFAARFVDRLGKGIRGAPRDALLADIAPPPLRGAAYGLRQALDSVGALCGPLLAVLLMLWLHDDLKAAMWFALPPAALAVALLVGWVHEPATGSAASGRGVRLRLADARRLPGAYWAVVATGSAFTLARFSEAFLVLRARDTGLSLGYVPFVMVVMNIVYAGAAYPAGAAADRRHPRGMLAAGLAVLVAADLTLAAARTTPVVLAGAALWGLHMALTQGLLSKLVADTTPAALRGTGFGLFNFASGVALLLASAIAGLLWNAHGAAATFLAGAAFAALSGVGLLAIRTPHHR